MSKPIYLDYAAATPMDSRVIKAMDLYWSDNFYNPSATYLAGKKARVALGYSRATIAGWLGARPAEIVFTAGATEANNLAIQGVMRQFPEAEILVSELEHDSVLAPAREFNYRQIPVDTQGTVDLQKLENLISDKTVLVSVMYVNNELGTVQPLSAISQILNKLSKSRVASGNDLPLYLHSDAAQAGNYLDLHTDRLGVDMLSINGSKIYGPKQSGALYIKTGTKLQPLILGGGQENGYRSGTENLASAAGLAMALDIAQTSRQTESKRVKALRDLFIRGLKDSGLPMTVNGSLKHSAPHILSATFDGIDNERLMMQLDERGIQCAVGSACSASSQEPSHVLAAIGLSPVQARSTLRFSLGSGTTEQNIEDTITNLNALLS